MWRERIVHFSLDLDSRQRFNSAVENFGNRGGHQVVASAATLFELENLLKAGIPYTLILVDRKGIEEKDAGKIVELAKKRRFIIYSSDEKRSPSEFMDALTYLQV